MTKKERREQKTVHHAQQQEHRAAMGRAQRDGALARLGLPLDAREPERGIVRFRYEVTIPGCTAPVTVSGWDARFGETARRFAGENQIVAQAEARRWLATQRQEWLRVHHAAIMRIQVRERIEVTMRQLGELCDDALLGADCAGFLGEARLQLGFAAAQIEDDGTITGAEGEVEQ